MKANAPEKVYFTSNEDGTHYYTEGIPSERKYVEYVRKDDFIERAEEFIYIALNDGIMGTANIKDFMRLFKNYLKGE